MITDPKSGSTSRILERGKCSKRHPLLTEEDVLWDSYGYGRTRRQARCRACVTERNKIRGKRRRELNRILGRGMTNVRRQVEGNTWEILLSCNHYNYYKWGRYAPPQLGDLVNCYKCNDYSTVVVLSDWEMEKDESDQVAGRSEDGVERQPILEHSFGSAWPDSVDPRRQRVPGCSY